MIPHQVLDYEETEHAGRVVRIASVAALGGLLFGYDSAVINGAVSAIEDQFGVGDATLGFAVASALLGAAVGALTAGRLADRIGRLRVMKIAALLFFISAIGAGLPTTSWAATTTYWAAERRLDAGGLPDHRRHRRRRGLRHRADVHRGDLAAAHPRAARLAAAAGDRVGHLPVAGDRLPAGATGRRVRRRAVAGAGGLAMDVPRDGGARDRLRCAGLHHSRVAALSRCAIPHSGGPQGADQCCSARRSWRSRSPGSRNR